MLHSIHQLTGNIPDPMPNIVFSGTVVAPESGAIYQKYIQPILECDTLPFVVFRHNDINSATDATMEAFTGTKTEVTEKEPE